MPNLSKLDETIDQLEKQAEMLKQNNKVLAKVSDLSTSIEKGVNELNIGNKNFEGTKKEIQKILEYEPTLLTKILLELEKEEFIKKTSRGLYRIV